MPKAKKASQLTKALPKVKTGAKTPAKSPSKGTGGKPLLKAAREVQLTPKEAEEAEEWAAAQARVVARFKEMREEARRGNFEMIPLEKSLYNYTALDSAARHAFEVDGYQGASVQPSTRTGRIKAKVEDIVECFQLMQKMPFRNQLDSLTFKPKQIICFGLGQLVCDEFTSKQKSRHDFRFESSPALVEHVVACEWNRHNTNTSFQMAWLLVAQKHFDGCQVLVYDPAHKLHLPIPGASRACSKRRGPRPPYPLLHAVFANPGSLWCCHCEFEEAGEHCNRWASSPSLNSESHFERTQSEFF